MSLVDDLIMEVVKPEKNSLKNLSFLVSIAARCHRWVADLLPYQFLLLVGLLLLLKKCQDRPLPYLQSLKLNGSLFGDDDLKKHETLIDLVGIL